jgi:protein-ribulosamine 3-kinase
VILPEWLGPQVEAELGETILQATPLGGGCVSPAARLQTKPGRVFFLKWAVENQRGQMFSEEARSLRKIAETNVIRVPAVIATSTRWLVLEWLPPFAAHTAEWRQFGVSLARLHRVQHEQFGWTADNYIGPLNQENPWSQSWPEFWQKQRLLPQLRNALNTGRLNANDRQQFLRLFGQLATLLDAGQREGPSLLHGDLWSGNVLGTSGSIAIVDPASYYGHREVDLAMAELFGGFPDEFRDAYQREWPLEAGFERRRAVYQLYYLLVHINLFGGSYVSGTRTALDRALGN